MSVFPKPGGLCFTARMGDEGGVAGGEHALGTLGRSLEAWREPEAPDLTWGGPLWACPLSGPHGSQCGP